MNAKVKYMLSQEGQKAALIAGRPATASVEETMEVTPDQISAMTVGADGSLFLDASKFYLYHHQVKLDAPPANAGEVIGAWLAMVEKVDAANAARRAAELEAAELDRLARIAEAEEVEPIVAAFCAGDPMPAGWTRNYYGYGFDSTAKKLRVSQDQKKRIDEKLAADEAAKNEAIAVAKEAKKQAMRDEVEAFGGYRWESAGMCAFDGRYLWRGGQSKRWVGKFSQARGIDDFLTSPKGEHIFDVSGLVVGDRIQGGGYDVNSRGKRRNESEWFGIVMGNDESGLVVKVVASRAEALKSH